jgi:hypothetical protein
LPALTHLRFYFAIVSSKKFAILWIPVDKTTTPSGPLREIIAFHQDSEGHWVADLECRHTRHVRHNPPWENREWVTTPEGRAAWIGRELPCSKCSKP